MPSRCSGDGTALARRGMLRRWRRELRLQRSSYSRRSLKGAESPPPPAARLRSSPLGGRRLPRLPRPRLPARPALLGRLPPAQQLPLPLTPRRRAAACAALPGAAGSLERRTGSSIAGAGWANGSCAHHTKSVIRNRPQSRRQQGSEQKARSVRAARRGEEGIHSRPVFRRPPPPGTAATIANSAACSPSLPYCQSRCVCAPMNSQPPRFC